jgi:hypothetical protein
MLCYSRIVRHIRENIEDWLSVEGGSDGGPAWTPSVEPEPQVATPEVRPRRDVQTLRRWKFRGGTQPKRPYIIGAETQPSLPGGPQWS